MIVGQRIKARLPVIGISAAELARRIGASQSGVANLISGRIRSTSNLHKIARELQTTTAYLTGETDDPDEGAPPPPPPPDFLHVMLPVALPSTNALTRMFEGLFEVVDWSAPRASLARELAELLPSGLSALKGPLIEGDAARRLEKAAAAVRATADREPAQ